MTEIFCHYDGILRETNPYKEGFRRNFDDLSGPGCYDPGLSEFPECFKEYSEWCIEHDIYMSLADDTPFIDDEDTKMYVSILQFDCDEDATAFKLRWL